MYLKQIELQGFKSFAEPTIISFVSGGFMRGKSIGTTAIVGPNGSGKSNVSDAIRWVMGEQSMKSLRGKKSEDVIFSGSDKKGKMSLARVALVFDNHDHVLPVEYDEVVVERKMYRNGDAEYRINGARVRLLDIVDTLARAGIGKGSHCVVGQGMTDAILNATPVERRLMIEDAAGVKHDQIRKVRSEKKLEKTKENLVRTRELIAEVEPRLRMLKRQAEKAAKGKIVYEELKDLQRKYFSYMWHVFSTERVIVEAQKKERGIAVKNAERTVDTLNDKIAAEAQKVEKAQVVGAYEDEKKALYEAMRRADQDIAIAQGRIEVEKERIAAEKKVKSIPVDLQYVRERLHSIQKKQHALLQVVERVESLDALDAVRADIAAVQKDLDRLYEDAGKKTVALPSTANEEKLTAMYDAIVAHEKAMTQAQEVRTHKQTELTALNEKITQEVSNDQAARTQFFALEKEARAAQDILYKERELFNEVKIALARIEVHEEELIREAQQDMHVHVADLAYDGTEIDREKTALRINKLKGEYERIGAIDPMVVEEYEETKERFAFLTKESDDLEEAMIKLRTVIKEMDKKIHDAFVSAYKDIDEEFTKYFRILFSGGNARLKKITVETGGKKKKSDHESDDMTENSAEPDEEKLPLKTDIGVEIVATPPGKKIKQLSLLSGGERSLTSIAMLFAIIAYNPPPFIVLDEVEAALDEANSRRLAKIFAELSKKTQFVIITHNRETMRHADMLYGVTMGNDGMSQVLSVKLDQLTKEGEIR